MKKQCFYAVFIATQLILAIQIQAQVGINIDDDSQPDPSAILDVKSSTKGFLPPRVALSSINSAVPITAPADGLLVYNTANAGIAPNNVMAGYYYWNGTRWVSVAAPQGMNIGDMLFWNGTQWVSVPAGSNGQVLTFNNGVPTWGGIQVPVVSTTAVSNITINSATMGGNVTSDGGSPLISRGVCWNTSSNPTIANSHTTDGAGIGVYESSLSNLSLGTLYHLRAYATNSEGTSYGNQVSFTTATFYIGQSFGGGIIFYIDSTGLGGLISATSDQSSAAQWGCEGVLVNATGSSIGTGQTNTMLIVNNCSAQGIAAKICNDLVLNGYSDWFLPSIDELYQMSNQNNIIGGFTNSYYWSSTETNSTIAFYLLVGESIIFAANKSYNYKVRAIRAF
jgi:hypothetical protein